MSLRAWFLVATGLTVSLVAFPGLAHTSSVVSMDWGLGCSNGPLDVSYLGYPLLMTWVVGQDRPQRAFELQFVVRRTFVGGVPDAWRFDAAGCASDRMAFEWENPAMPKVCFFLGGAGVTSAMGTREYDPDAGVERLGWRMEYDPATSRTNPSAPYRLVWMVIDWYGFVPGPSDPPANCSGIDEPVCIALASATWTDPDGAVHAWTIATPWATVNAASLGGAAACMATPAQRATWGTIKAQYR